MACGLGAMILLFFILDFKEGSDVLNDNATKATTIIEEEKSDFYDLKEKENSLISRIDKISRDLALSIEEEIELSVVEDLSIPTKSVSEVPGQKNAPNSLIGLSIKGAKILIILDASASMSYSKLVDIIIGIDDKSGNYLKNGPKWRQAKNIGKWLIENAPETSEVRSIGFSDQIKFADKSWQSQKAALLSFNQNVKKLYPSNGTSLAAALEYVDETEMNPTDIYLITDGLPTLAGANWSGRVFDKLQNKLKGCGSRKNLANLVDGDCRKSLFINAVNGFQSNSKIVINVILLPLEGDPDSAPLFQKWVSQAGGSFLSPSRNWLL